MGVFWGFFGGFLGFLKVRYFWGFGGFWRFEGF